MTEQPNRIGAALGVHGHGLDAIYHRLGLLLEAVADNTAAIAALAGAQAAPNPAWGLPSDTDCNMNALELLCAIATQLGLETTTPLPEGPAYRCGNVFQGGYHMASQWLPTSSGRVNAPNAFYAGWTTENDNPVATVISLTLEGDTAPLPTISPGIVPRTVCMSAYIGSGVELFAVDRYNAADQTYHDTSFLGLTDFSDPWVTGATFNVSNDYVYRFYVVLTEGITAPPPELFLFYTEGGLG